MERSAQTEGRVRAEHHAGWIQEPEIRVRNGGTESAVNPGCRTSGHAADNVLHRIRSGEGRAFSGMDVELLKTVEQI